MKRFILSALLALLAANSSITLAYSNITQQQVIARAEQIGDVNYHLSLNLSKNSSTFTGSNTIEFTLRHKKRDVVLDFTGKLVNSVIINGQKTSNFTFDAKDHSVILPRALLNKGSNSVSVAFEGQYSDDGTGLHHFVDPKDNREYLYTDFQPANAHRVFPGFDQPNLKAVFVLDVNAPVNWRVISNMSLSKSTQDNVRKHSWFKPTKKISTYIFHMSAGAYAMWEDYSGKYPMRIFARQSLAAHMDAERVFDTTQKGMRFFEAYYDYDYPFTKYDQIFVPEFNAGAMENAGAVTFGEFQLFRTAPTQDDLIERDVTILHELAHMWFGNLVTMDWWDDLWLNESFASIMGYQGLEGIGQSGAWDRAARYKEWAYKEDQLMTTHPILSDIPDILAASANFDGITYAKGLSVLRQLQYLIGPDKFRDGIRQYFKQYAFKNTRLTDFIGALETAHGQKLKPWVDSWLGTADVNTMKLDFAVNHGKIAGASVTQTGGVHNPTLRQHANLIGLYYLEQGRLTLKETVKVLFDGQKTPLPALNGKPAPAIILPNTEDYDYVKIRLDDRSLAWLKTNMAQVTDSATKTIVWRALWDMVRDQQMKASDYFVLSAKQLAVEDDTYVLAFLLDKAEVVVNAYTSNKPLQSRYRHQIFTLAKQKVNTLTGGSDLQRQWYTALNMMANTDDHFKYLTDVYDEKITIEGLGMNATRQWEILQALAGGNRKAAVQARIAALMEVDKSASGRNEMLMTEALYPDKATKAEAWRKLTIGTDYSLREKKAIIDGLYNADYPELATANLDKYFALIEAIDQKGESYEYASYFIREAVPNIRRQEGITAIEQFLETSSVPGTYKKQMMKQLDRLKRMLKVRALND